MFGLLSPVYTYVWVYRIFAATNNSVISTATFVDASLHLADLHLHVLEHEDK
jgi:hypothetical protein